MNGVADEARSFEDVRVRVMHMVAELCADQRCAVFNSLDTCVTNAIAARWSSPVKVFIPLFAYRDVRRCIEQGSCPDDPADSTA